MTYMRFIIAPDWFMKLPDDHLLQSKAVLQIYGFMDKDGLGRPSNILVKNGAIPPPNVITPRGKLRNLRWSVGYLKNYLKLPTELIEVKGDVKDTKV
jgi:hypothetical protein